MKSLRGLSLIVVGLLVSTASAHAQTRVHARNPEFVVPAKLKGRVGFWVKIFTQYGEHQEVIHHRAYPQIVFRVVDFSQASKAMSDAELDRYREREMTQQFAEVRRAIEHLAAGAAPQSDLEQRINANMSVLGPGTAKYQKMLDEDLIRSQTGIRERMEEAIARSGRYMRTMESIFANEEHIPVELTRIPFIESSFDYKARSSVGAAGIWQFMAGTARYQRMNVGSVVDERLDVIEASRAAAKYLRHAHEVLGSWPLAITSYNHGITGVLRKSKQLGTTNIAEIVEHPTTRLLGFASNNFYPEFLAALEVYDNYQTYFPGLQIEKPLSLVEYRLPQPVSVSYISERVGVPVADLMPLNYGLTPAAWTGRYRLPQGYNLKIPPQYVERLALLGAPQPSAPAASSVYGGVVYTVRKGDTLIKLAKKYNISVAKLKQINDIGPAGIHVGQRLIAREHEDGKPRAVPAVHAIKETPAPATGKGDGGTYLVKQGDSLYRIAKNHGVSVAALRQLNGIKGNSVTTGQQLVVAKGGAPKQEPDQGAARATLKPEAIQVAAAAPPPARKPAASGTRSYSVKKGESLWSVSRKFKVPVEDLKRANNLTGNEVRPGQRLVLPARG